MRPLNFLRRMELLIIVGELRGREGRRTTRRTGEMDAQRGEGEGFATSIIRHVDMEVVVVVVVVVAVVVRGIVAVIQVGNNSSME